MGIVELVLETADADRQLLDADREQGDRAEVPRDIDSVLRAATEDRARLVCDSVTDLGSGRADRSDPGEDGGSRPWRVVVTIMAPATAEIACSLSGLMACLSKLYDLDYEGWVVSSSGGTSDRAGLEASGAGPNGLGLATRAGSAHTGGVEVRIDPDPVGMTMTRSLGRLAGLAVVVGGMVGVGVGPAGPVAWAQEVPARKTPRRDPPGTYMGRPIAAVMSYQGADWLFRDEREAEEQPERMIDALKIRPGQTVADVGAGAGYTSLRLARRVGAGGVVLATDVQPQMLAMLRDNAKAAGAKNIRPVRATQKDVNLPEAGVDLALMVDVYHEASDPEALLVGLNKALKPGGRLVLVEFRGEDPEVPIKPEHKMTLDQVRREVEPQGFRFVESLEFLPWQHIIVFEKPTAPAKAG